MNSKNIFRVLNFLFLFLGLIFSGLAFYKIFSNNILNFKYINYILLAVVILLTCILLILIIKNKGRIFTIILALVFLISSYFANAKLDSLVNTLNKLNTNATVMEQTMSIAVLKDSNISSIKDLVNTEIAAPLEADKENIDALLKNVKENENVDISLVESDSYVKGYDSLINGKTNAIVLNSSYENIIELNDSDYAKKIKKVYEFKIQKTVEKKLVASNKDTLNIYISGIDTYGPITSVARSDVNIIMTVNKKNNKILLTTTPRDSYVRIAGGGNNQYDKLTHSGVYGIESSIGTLENLYDIKIDYYARINFTSFLKLIDIVGGVDVYNDQEFISRQNKIHFPVGMVHLDAQKALDFVRERYSLADGDNDRGKNQQKVISAIIKKLTTTSALTNSEQILKELSNSIQTDMPASEIMNLANEQISKKSEYIVSSQALKGIGTMGLPSYAMPGYNLYMSKVDESSLNEMQANIKEVLEGK